MLRLWKKRESQIERKTVAGYISAIEGYLADKLGDGDGEER